MSAFHADLRPGPDGSGVLAVAGDIDLATAHKLLEAATPHLTPSSEPFRLDLSEVSFLDSTGIGALLEIRAAALKVEREVQIVAMATSVARVLQLAGLEDVFHTSDNTV